MASALFFVLLINYILALSLMVLIHIYYSSYAQQVRELRFFALLGLRCSLSYFDLAFMSM